MINDNDLLSKTLFLSEIEYSGSSSVYVYFNLDNFFNVLFENYSFCFILSLFPLHSLK